MSVFRLLRSLAFLFTFFLWQILFRIMVVTVIDLISMSFQPRRAYQGQTQFINHNSKSDAHFMTSYFMLEEGLGEK